MPSIRELERRLAAQAAAKPSATSSQDVILAIGEQASLVKAYEDRQKKMETDSAEMRKERGKMQDDFKEAQSRMASAHDEMALTYKAAVNEANEMTECHKREMQEMNNKMEALKKELASEQQARARAESQLEAVRGSEARMEKLVAGFKIPAPVVQNNAAPPRSATATVTKRDGNGRIASFTITQSS
jgi:chromosome segregation ATPase